MQSSNAKLCSQLKSKTKSSTICPHTTKICPTAFQQGPFLTISLVRQTVQLREIRTTSTIRPPPSSGIKAPRTLYTTRRKNLSAHRFIESPQIRAYHKTPTPFLTMSDDASYTAFLNKANEDPKAGATSSESTSQTKSKFDPTSTDNDALPASLKSIPDEITYTSDTDSPFEPIVLNYSSDELPSKSDFKKALGAKAEQGDIEELSLQEFDPRNQYAEIIERVKKAGSGKKEVKIFRVELGRTRVEYYIVTVGERKLVGVVTKAVES